MTRYIFHGACHLGLGHADARRRLMAALLLPPLSASTAATARCCAACEDGPAPGLAGGWYSAS